MNKYKMSIMKHLETVKELHNKLNALRPKMTEGVLRRSYEKKIFDFNMSAFAEMRMALIARVEEATPEEAFVIMQFLLGLKDE